MLVERLKWLGSLIVAEVGTWLAWKQIASAVPHWSQWVALGVIALGALLYFPYAKGPDGATQRLIAFRQRGRRNVTIIPGNNSPVTGNVSHTGSGAQTINNGLQLTLADIRQVSIDASHAEVLPAARAVASQAAIAEIDHRTGAMTDKVLERINRENPGLFVRWDDPRFLAALTSVQRSYAETGDEDLGNTLASLVAGMASKPIRSMHEIVLRQAIDIAPHLTSPHLKAVAVSMLMTRMSFVDPYDADELITALDAQFSPYYDQLPTSQIDYPYMSSTGVGYYTEGLQDLGNRPYQILHKRFRNSMYESFRFADLRDILADPKNHRLVSILPASRDDVHTEGGRTIVSNIQDAKFRLPNDGATTILSNAADAENLLSQPERQLRKMVNARTLSAEQFRDRIAGLMPRLSDFFTTLEQSGAMNFQLHPVGMILARHEMGERLPHLAANLDAAFDEV